MAHNDRSMAVPITPATGFFIFMPSSPSNKKLSKGSRSIKNE
jgi:hypothetical protein